MATDPPRRWHIYVVDFAPQVRSKPGKHRPCLAVQPSEIAAAGHSSTVILPLTSKVGSAKAFPLRVRLPAGTCQLKHDSDVMVDQIIAWDNSLFSRDLGAIDEVLQEEVRRAMIDFLDL